jgi:hypothetical protein
MGIKGQDWASYQSTTPDLTGLDFAFTKVTEGLSYVSAKWAAQRDHAKKAGLVWGAYHYPHMANDPIKEADYFLKQVAWQPGDIIVLDWEGYDAANKGVSNARKLQYRDAWLKYVKGKMPHNPVGMYCNTEYWLNIDKSSNCGDFLWIATGGKDAGHPGIQSNWMFHQYSTAGGVDHDYCPLPSRQALKDWALSFGPKKPNTPEEVPTLSGMTAEDVFNAVWQRDAMGPIAALQTKDNQVWMASSMMRDIQGRLVAMQKAEAAQTAAITALAGLVGKGVDTKTVVAAVQKAIADAVVKVDVSVDGAQA